MEVKALELMNNNNIVEIPSLIDYSIALVYIISNIYIGGDNGYALKCDRCSERKVKAIIVMLLMSKKFSKIERKEGSGM